MKVLITDIATYLKDTTKVSDFKTAKTVKGFFFQNLQLNVYDEKNIMPIIDILLTQFLDEMRPEKERLFKNYRITTLPLAFESFQGNL